MTDIRMTIDGREIRTTEGTTVLEVARGAGITVPTLCHEDRLQPYGGCRLCIVEAEAQGGKSIVASCVHRAEDGLVIHTRSEKIDRIRRSILELLLAHAPESPPLQELAREYGADASKFEGEASFCVHCGLCVRYCAEIKQKHAVGFIDRGIRKEICFLPEIASTECNDCMECFPLCPTSYLQAAFVLAESLAFRNRRANRA
jgi:NADH dehydrogenase/NADH:ubiquinone oxidoreductase subunit G